MPVPVPGPSGCRSFPSRGAFRDAAEANSARTQSSRRTAARLILTGTGSCSAPVRYGLPTALPQRDGAAAAGRHRLSPRLHPEIRARRGGGHRYFEFGREKQLVSSTSSGKSRMRLRLLLAAAERTLQVPPESASSPGGQAAYTRRRHSLPPRRQGTRSKRKSGG